MTVQQLINQVLRKIGVLAAGESPSTDESADALAALNQMLNEWNTLRAAIYTMKSQAFATVGAQASYSMGAGGNFNVARPVKIERATITVATGYTAPVEIIGSAAYAEIVQKALAGVPEKLYPDYAFPLCNLALWPVPSGTPALTLWWWQPLITADLVLTDTVSYPPAYEQALVYNLAVVLASEYGRALPTEIAAMAERTKAQLGALNAPEAPAPQAPLVPAAQA